MEDIKSLLHQQFSLSQFGSQLMAKIMTAIVVDKGEIFVTKGKKNDKEYLVVNGICRTFIVNDLGDDITLSFFTSNTTISPNLVRTKSQQSVLNIQALSKVKLVCFQSSDLMHLMNTHREIEVWANGVLQRELLQKVEKEINTISLNAKDRLVHFRSKYPMLENQIPHSYIASFLGITNVSLSRLRKELAKA